MNNWVLWLIVGIIGVVGGLAALFNPFVATFTAVQIAAWFFLLAAGFQLYAIFQENSWRQRLWAVVLAAAFVWLGITLLLNPLEGVVSLTLAAAILFLINGVAKIFFSLTTRGTGHFWLIVLSGLVSIALAVMVFTNFQQAAEVLLGIVLAVELLSTGAAMIAFAFFVRGHKDEFAPAG